MFVSQLVLKSFALFVFLVLPSASVVVAQQQEDDVENATLMTSDDSNDSSLLLPGELLDDNVAVYTLGDAGYENATSVQYMLPTWLKYQPPAVVYADTPEEISSIVRWALEETIDATATSATKEENDGSNEASLGLISPVGGGHSSAGYSMTGNAVAIRAGPNLSKVGPLNTQTETLVVGAGAICTDIANYLNGTGYVTATGVCPDVGISGWTLGGGYSPFSKFLGLGSDNVVSFDIVLPNGTYVENVHEHNHDDLFWAVRGAGHQSFGHVTSWTIRVLPLPSFLIHTVPDLPCEMDPEFCANVLNQWQRHNFYNKTWVDSKLATYSFHMSRNLSKGIDAPITVTFTFVYADSSTNANEILDAILQPFHEYIENNIPSGSKFKKQSYVETKNMYPLFHLDDEGYGSVSMDPNTNTYEAKVGLYLKKEMTLEDWRVLVDTSLGVRKLLTDGATGMYFVFEVYSNAITDKPSDYNAHYQRAQVLGDMYYDVFSASEGSEAIDELNYNNSFAWLQSLYTGGDNGRGTLDKILYRSYNDTIPQQYVNYRNILLGEGNDRWPALQSYYGENLCRLVDIKKRYDPYFIFDFPQGIPILTPEGMCDGTSIPPTPPPGDDADTTNSHGSNGDDDDDDDDNDDDNDATDGTPTAAPLVTAAPEGVDPIAPTPLSSSDTADDSASGVPTATMAPSSSSRQGIAFAATITIVLTVVGSNTYLL